MVAGGLQTAGDSLILAAGISNSLLVSSAQNHIFCVVVADLAILGYLSMESWNRSHQVNVEGGVLN